MTCCNINRYQTQIHIMILAFSFNFKGFLIYVIKLHIRGQATSFGVSRETIKQSSSFALEVHSHSIDGPYCLLADLPGDPVLFDVLA